MSSKYLVKCDLCPCRAVHDLNELVIACLSGDTLILKCRPGSSPPERIVHLAEVTAPKLGTSQREDEAFAFESREYLRALVVGKEVTFESTYSLPSNDSIPRDVGIVTANGQDLTIEVLRNGWARLKEQKREATDEDVQRRAIENDAKIGGRGLWSSDEIVDRRVYYTMPSDSQGFMTLWKGKPIRGIVESVRDGSTLRVRLLLSNEEHQFVNLALAGVKCPRTAAREGEPSEPFGDEAKAFVEHRLLQRQVTITLLSLPTLGATPFSSVNTEASPSATVFIGNAIHPQGGNIAEHIIAGGLGKVIDWHAGMLAAGGAMERIRGAERSAKEKRLKLYGASTASAPGVGVDTGMTTRVTARNAFEGVVTRIWGADQISVYDSVGRKERRLQLSSVRGPKTSDPKQLPYANEAKEFLRKKLIGKTVSVRIDFIRPPEGEYEERECATIIYQKANVAEQLVERGLATAVRHRRDDDKRSPDYDKLMAAETAATTGTKGMHSGKEIPPPRIVNVSETHSKASQFLPHLKRQGRVPVIIDYVAAGSRFRLLLPKDNQTVSFVLSGIRAPRTTRTAGEKSEPYGAESLEYATRHYLQRDAEAQFEAVDKSGGFIGSLYIPQADKTSENVAVALVREGLGTVHDYSAEALPFSKQLYEAQDEAKGSHRNIWKDHVEQAEVEATEPELALQPKYLDCFVTDVRTTPSFGFSVQLLGNDGVKVLERLMGEFTLYHKAAKSSSAFAPKSGDLVSARFSADRTWYRAKVRRANPTKKEYDVVFTDYGNQEIVSAGDIRPLDERFRTLPPQAQDARLSFVKMPEPSSDYYDEAVARFRELTDGRKIVANIDAREGPILHLRLIEPSASASPTDSINCDLVREGYCIVDRKGCKYLSAYPAIAKRLNDEADEARRARSGMYEYGDISED